MKTHLPFFQLLLWVVAICPTGAFAINKCAQVDGSVTYQDSPCPDRAIKEEFAPYINSGVGQSYDPPAHTLGSQSVIRAKSRTEWPDDYRMQAYCEKKQGEALRQLASPPNAPTSEAKTIRQKCANEWPDDYRMQAYCEKEQGEALRQLASPPNAPTSEAKTIRQKCANEWPDDYRMQAYCEKKQAEALQKLR